MGSYLVVGWSRLIILDIHVEGTGITARCLRRANFECGAYLYGLCAAGQCASARGCAGEGINRDGIGSTHEDRAGRQGDGIGVGAIPGHGEGGGTGAAGRYGLRPYLPAAPVPPPSP